MIPTSAKTKRFVAVRDLRLKLRDRLRPRSSQRDPPGHRELHRTAHRNVRGRAGGQVAGPAKPLAFGFSKLPLGEIRQFEIVEEQIDKFIAAQNEPERIFTVAFTRLGRSSAALLLPNAAARHL